MRLRPFNLRLLYLSIFSLFLLASCKEEEINPIDEVDDGPHAEVNTWIHDVMKEVYLWTDDIPDDISKNQEPEVFFDALLYSGDRFSALVPDYDELINSLNGVTYEGGYEYSLAKTEDDNVVAIVTYIKENSPAVNTDLKRGDVITEINGSVMTINNYRDILEQTESTHTLTFRRYDNNLGSFTDQPELEMSTVVLAENPNFTHKVITSQSGKKVGYFVYNFFSSGPDNDSKAYDEEMIQVFSDFQAQGIDELVLDLRYNSGGSLTSAVNLASLIGRGIDNTKVFSENRWNSLYQDYIEGLEDGDAILRRRFVDLTQNIGDNLASGKFYVLTSSRTASASELVINGLSPFMDVHIIGDKTVGKNVGSIPIEDDENAENPIGLLPIVLKTYNSLGQSNYENGFNPAPEDIVSDLQFPMLPLGDPEEPLLARALEHIDGVTGRRDVYTEKYDDRELEIISSSLDKKIRSNRLIID